MAAINLGMPQLSRTDPGLYWDPEAREGEGARITTHSMLKTMRRCAKQSEYKYVHRLKPKKLGSPLKRGTWMHSLLEAYHSGEDWRKVHTSLSQKFNSLFDEEKDFYGDMPTEILSVMESYIWHYANDPWTYHAAEFQLEAELPDGSLYRGKVDAMIENEYGFWIVDHKTHKTLPDHSFRLLDAQSALYLWAARENGINVQGFIWNYIKWKPATVPALVDKGRRLTKSAVETDYPTYVKAIKRYKAENPDTFRITQEYKDQANYLKSLRYEPGAPQRSPFFRRDILEKSDDLLDRVVQEATRTSLRMHTYDFSDGESVERSPDRSCTFSCSYTDICGAELMTGGKSLLRRQNYTVGDPNDYYKDQAGETPRDE